MSPLWQSKKIMKLQTNHMRPSPNTNSNLSLARDFLNGKSPYQAKLRNVIEETSLFTFLWKRVGAGMTVEAAMVLPLFTFFFLNISSVIEMIRLHGNLQLALWNVGRQLAVYSCVLDSTEAAGEENGGGNAGQVNGQWQGELADIAFSYTYIKGEMINYVGEKYLENSPLTYGADGLQFWESDIFTQNDSMELIVTYSVSPFSEMVGFKPFRMANRYYGHVWNGYQIPGAEDNGIQENVYVAENGRVYHQDRNCTHLALSVQQVTIQEALLCKNIQGARYSECEKCAQGRLQSQVYITNEGNRYHCDKNCPGLKRTVFTIPKEKAVKYKPCKRCSGG